MLSHSRFPLVLCAEPLICRRRIAKPKAKVEEPAAAPAGPAAYRLSAIAQGKTSLRKASSEDLTPRKIVGASAFRFSFSFHTQPRVSVCLRAN